MARKNLLQSVMGKDGDQPASEKRSNYALKGASGKMKASLDSLAEDAKKMLEGETIVEIDTSLIDASFINDRLSADDEDFEALKSTIAREGQDTPILLRPHPEEPDRYMIVFGHRRARVARALDRPVRAVIKSMDDLAHVLAQGQENSARADLSFVEKALFAKRLLDLGQSKDVIQKALTIDATLLSRMLSVAQKVPVDVIEAIGPAKSIGRDRWENFKKLVVVPANRKTVMDAITEDAFIKRSSDEKFEHLLSTMEKSGSKSRRTKTKIADKPQAMGDVGKVSYGKRDIKMVIEPQYAEDFGAFLKRELKDLIERFKEERNGGNT